MLSLEEVARIASALPGVTEGQQHGNRAWFVGDKAFAWERPYSKADIRRFGEAKPPPEPVLAVRTAGLDAKTVILARNQPGFFMIPHFDGYAAVLITLASARRRNLEDMLSHGHQAMAKAAPT
ncbi:MAG: hypothetical protein ABR598_09120 [Candidatus Dormibacteria bacterium]